MSMPALTQHQSASLSASSGAGAVRTNHSLRRDVGDGHYGRYNPYGRGKERPLPTGEKKPQAKAQHDHKSGVWHKKEIMAHKDDRKTAAGSHDSEVLAGKKEFLSQGQNDAMFVKNPMSKEAQNISALWADTNVTMRSKSVYKVSKALDSDALKVNEEISDDTMLDVQGPEQINIEEDDLLGDELQTMHLMEVDMTELRIERSATPVVTETSLVVYRKEVVGNESVEAELKQRSVSRVLFPTKDASKQDGPIRRASPRINGYTENNLTLGDSLGMNKRSQKGGLKQTKKGLVDSKNPQNPHP